MKINLEKYNLFINKLNDENKDLSQREKMQRDLNNKMEKKLDII